MILSRLLSFVRELMHTCSNKSQVLVRKISSLLLKVRLLKFVFTVFRSIIRLIKLLFRRHKILIVIFAFYAYAYYTWKNYPKRFYNGGSFANQYLTLQSSEPRYSPQEKGIISANLAVIVQLESMLKTHVLHEQDFALFSKYSMWDYVKLSWAMSMPTPAFLPVPRPLDARAPILIYNQYAAPSRLALGFDPFKNPVMTVQVLEQVVDWNRLYLKLSTVTCVEWSNVNRRQAPVLVNVGRQTLAVNVLVTTNPNLIRQVIDEYLKPMLIEHSALLLQKSYPRESNNLTEISIGFHRIFKQAVGSIRTFRSYDQRTGQLVDCTFEIQALLYECFRPNFVVPALTLYYSTMFNENEHRDVTHRMRSVTFGYVPEVRKSSN